MSIIRLLKCLSEDIYNEGEEQRAGYRKMTTKHILDSSDKHNIEHDGKITLYHGTPKHKQILKSGHFHPGTYFSSDPELVKKRYMGQHASKSGKWKLLSTRADPADISMTSNKVYTARTHRLKPNAD